MNNNTVSIRGWVYRYTVRESSTKRKMCTFGLKFYDGKAKDENVKYTFVSCKGFEDFGLKEQQEVSIVGHLSGNDYTNKEGQRIPSLQIIVDSVGQNKPSNFNYTTQKEEQDNNDSIPF